MPGLDRLQRLAWCFALFALPVGSDADPIETARFAVTERVALADMEPFAVTIGGVGNALLGSSFEPRMFRTKIVATVGAADRVVAPPNAVIDDGTLREGALDGAEVDVFRIDEAGWRLIRRDRVAPGGHAASGWQSATGGRIVAPEAAGFTWRWRRTHRPGAETWFTVRAVDRFGALSPPAEPVVVTAPMEGKGGRAPNNRLIDARLRVDPSAISSRLRTAPEDLTVRLTEDGRAQLDWTPVRGRVAGYVVFWSDTAPSLHRGHHLALDGTGAEIMPGDRVFVRKALWPGRDGPIVADPVWTSLNGALAGTHDLLTSQPADLWSLQPHEPGTPVTDPGESYLRLTYTSSDGASIGRFAFAGREQTFYPVLNPASRYRAEVWLRGATTAPVQLRLTGPYRDVGPFPLSVGETWTRHEIEFTVPRVLEKRMAGRIELAFPGAGTVDVDNFRVYRADAPWLGWVAGDREGVAASGMSRLRLHALIKTGTLTYDLVQLLDRGRPITGRRPTHASLAQSLFLAREVGLDPWLQIEPHLSREEWLGLVEYLAAPYEPDVHRSTDRPWAALRAAQGQAQPWTDEFGSFYFEIGNETWNGLFAPWTFRGVRNRAQQSNVPAGAVYGLYQEYVLGVLRESPYWAALAPKLLPVLGGRSGNDYGRHAALASPSSSALTAAHYIGGWDENEGPATPDPAGLFRVTTATPQQIALRGAQLAADRSAVGRDLVIGTYEAGPGYALNGLNGRSVSDAEAAAQERAMKSRAAGTATLDAFLTLARAGYGVQSFFVFGRGALWASHAPWHRGGQAYPSWQLLTLMNRLGLGDVLEVEALDVPSANLPQVSRRRPAMQDAPLVAVYALRRGSRVIVAVLSRRVPGPDDDGRTQVEIDVPWSSAHEVRRYTLTGTYTSHNLNGPEVRLLETFPESAFQSGRLAVPDLGPAEAQVFVLEGVSQ